MLHPLPLHSHEKGPPLFERVALAIKIYQFSPPFSMFLLFERVLPRICIFLQRQLDHLYSVPSSQSALLSSILASAVPRFAWSKSTIHFVNSSRPLKPVILALATMKAMMAPCATNTHRYLDYSKSSYHIASEADYVPWIITTR